MTTTYSLMRTFDDDDSPYASTSFTTNDVDHINCAHMLASGFNTMSRNFMGDFVLAVVDTKAGTVQYDGKIEKFDRADKRRDMLESAYAELERVKNVLFDAGVETIPADRGVKDLSMVLFARDEKIAELYSELNKTAQELEALRKRDEFELHARQQMEAQHAQANEATRAELIEYVKRERAIWLAADKKAPVNHEHMRAWLRGMLDVLAKFLVVTGEADASEGHAVARRLCGISDE